MATARWEKTYATRDDFIADTGPVVHDSLAKPERRIYEQARVRTFQLLRDLKGRDLTITIVGTGTSAEIAILQNGKQVAQAKVARG